MRRLSAASLLACLALGAVTSRAAAFYPYPPPCPPPFTVSYVDKQITCYRPVVKHKDVECVVMKPHYKEHVTDHTHNVLVPEWKDERRTTTVMVPVWTEAEREIVVPTHKPRVVERDVVTCRLVPVTVTDPCTGCCYVTCKPEPVVHRVSHTVFDCVPEVRRIKVPVCSYKPESRDYTVRVCHYRTEERKYQVKHVTCEWKPETVVRRMHYTEPEAYVTTVKVPVLVPCH